MLNNLKGLSKDEQFRLAAEYAGLPEAVLRGIWKTESAEGKNMRSSAGARGHMQIMPETQRKLEDRAGREMNPDDLGDALTMASELMRENLAAAKGDVTTALRMYHGGWDRSQWGPVNAAYAGKVLGTGEVEPSTASTTTRPAPTTADLVQGGISGGRDVASLVDGGIEGREHTPALSVEDILSGDRSKATGPAKLDDFTAGLVEKARAVGAVDGVDEATAAAQAVRDHQEEARAAAIRPSIAAPSDVVGQQVTRAAMQTQEEALATEESRDTLDEWGARFDGGRTAAMVWELERSSDRDPNYNYLDRMDEVETPDMAPAMVSILRTARSQEDEKFLLDRIGVMQYSQQIISEDADSLGAQLGWGLLASIDPVDIAAGVGIGAGLGAVGLGARALFLAGRPVAGLAAASAEGAAGSLIADGVIVGMGGHRSGEEIAQDAAFGALLGSMFNARGAMRGVNAAAKNAASERFATELIEAAGDARARQLTQARELLGPDATPEQIQSKALAVSQGEYRTWVHANLQDVPDAERLLSLPEQWEGGSPIPKADVARIVNTYGLTNRTDNIDDFRFLIDSIHRSEKIAAANPIDESLRRSVLERVGLQADSTVLQASASPVARALGTLWMESPEGAAGRQARTASLDRSFRFEQLIGDSSARLGNAKSLFSEEIGHGRFGRIFRASEFESRFNNELTEEMLSRYQYGRSVSKSRAIREAADALDGAHGRAGEMVRVAKLPGWKAIPQGGRKGYFPRLWNGGAMRAASPERIQALRDALTDQLVRTAGFNQEFSSELAQRMLTRFQKRVVGDGARGGGGAVTDDVADALNDMNPEIVASYHKKFGTRTMAQLAERLDVDMLARYDDGAGGSMRLMDFVEQDQSKLLLRNAQRTAGYATMSKYNIVGRQGVEHLKDALRVTGATGPEISAFERMVVDMTGEGTGEIKGSLLRDMRLLTSAIRLGSASINQAGVYADALQSLGGIQVAEAMGAIPRLSKEAFDLANGKAVNNSILGQMEVGLGSPFGSSQYWHQGWGALDAHDLMTTAETAGLFSKVARGAAQAVHTMNGQRLLIAAQTRGMAEQITMRALRFIREGGEDAALRDMGLDDALVSRLRNTMNDLPDFAKFDERGVLSEFNPDFALNTAHEADTIALRNAIMRGTGQIMNHAFIGERGKWASNELMLFLLQFRTVSLVAQQKTLGRLVGVHGWQKTAMLQAGGMALTMPLHAGRVALRASLLPEDDREEYIERNMTVPVLARASMNYLTSVGLAGDALDLSGAFLQGWAGDALPEWMRPTSGRGGGFRGDLIGGQLAPGVGVIEDVAAMATGDWKKGRQAVPGASLPYIQPFLLGGTERLDDLLDE